MYYLKPQLPLYTNITHIPIIEIYFDTKLTTYYNQRTRQASRSNYKTFVSTS